ncbi:MAG: 1,4-alpha-glucan branching enzyme, partial [Bryobacteraceae bacterium]
MTSRLLDENDVYLFGEGTHINLADVMGAHIATEGGTRFAVWAPNARAVSVIGSFNQWDKHATPLSRTHDGIWEALVSDAEIGSRYKYHVKSNFGGYKADKADPFGFFHEVPPQTGSIVW